MNKYLLLGVSILATAPLYSADFSEDECPICYASIKDVAENDVAERAELSCQHALCRGCLETMVKHALNADSLKSLVCPICRQPIAKDEIKNELQKQRKEKRLADFNARRESWREIKAQEQKLAILKDKESKLGVDISHLSEAWKRVMATYSKAGSGSNRANELEAERSRLRNEFSSRNAEQRQVAAEIKEIEKRLCELKKLSS